ncbi:MAG TPA: carbonic anhydrase [Blastocatellia bacterium]|nr:carbonic anhydrase [Blastocatellia bacterium]
MMLRLSITVCLLFAICFIALPKDTTNLTADQALQKLLQGNKRYMKGAFLHPDQAPANRIDVAKNQNPFAIILGCSDSRVPPEVIFDQGLGAMSVLRVGGNVLNDPELGSMEFVVQHFNTPLIMVLGHQKCGAITAALSAGALPGHVASFVDPVRPAVERIKGQPGDPVENGVRANVQFVVDQIKSSGPILSDLVKSGKLKVVGAEYNLETGAVEILH